MRVALAVGLIAALMAGPALGQSYPSPYSGKDPYNIRSFDPPKNRYESGYKDYKGPRQSYDRPGYEPYQSYKPYRSEPLPYDIPSYSAPRRPSGTVDSLTQSAERAAGRRPRDVIRPSAGNSVFSPPVRGTRCYFSTCR